MSQPLNRSSRQHPLEIEFLQMCFHFSLHFLKKAFIKPFETSKRGMLLTNFSFISGIRLKKLNSSIKYPKY